jgi:hypothetical protein
MPCNIESQVAFQRKLVFATSFMLFLGWLILRRWEWRWHIPLKCWLTFNRLHVCYMPEDRIVQNQLTWKLKQVFDWGIEDRIETEKFSFLIWSQKFKTCICLILKVHHICWIEMESILKVMQAPVTGQNIHPPWKCTERYNQIVPEKMK